MGGSPRQPRVAVTISIESVASIDGREFQDLSALGGLADALAARLHDPPFAFSSAAYHALSADQIQSRINEVMACDARARIVHLIGHAESSENDLHFFGSDGLVTNPINDWTREASALMRRQSPSQTVPTLFVVDACSAGTAIIEQLLHMNDDLTIHKWVIAAVGHRDTAFGGWLSRAFGNVLDQLRNEDLDLADDTEFLAFLPLAHAVRKEVRRLTGGDVNQLVRNTPVEIDAQGVFTIFPNPAFVPGGKSRPDSRLVPFMESLAFDATHWRTRAAGLSRPGDTGMFAGRKPELEIVRSFIHKGDSPLLLVTGAPGSGKSALLGLVVCNAHALLHQETVTIWSHMADHLSGIQTELVAVHARRLGLQEIVDSLAQQMGYRQGLGPQDLLDLIASRAEPPVVVIDALDEASASSLSSSAQSGISELVDGFILPALRRGREDGRPAVRLVLGSRKWVGDVSLADVFDEYQLGIDLDDVPVERLRSELEEYATARLQQGLPHWRTEERRIIAQSLAQRLVAAESSTKLGAQFLCAGLFLSTLIDDAPSPTEARASAMHAPATLAELLHADLNRRANRENLLALLRATALAKGAGAPISVISELAGAIDSGLSERSVRELRELLQEDLSFYLRTSTDTDGTKLYRLFHQGVVDFLVDRRTQIAIAEYIVHMSVDPGAYERPYFQRHLIEHASDVDRNFSGSRLVDDLWLDMQFVVAADPAIARSYPPRSNPAALTVWEVHSWCQLTTEMAPGHRQSILAATASRWPAPRLRDELNRLGDGSTWRPNWGSLRERSQQYSGSGSDGVPFMWDAGRVPPRMDSTGFLSARAASTSFKTEVTVWTGGAVDVRIDAKLLACVDWSESAGWVSSVAVASDGTSWIAGNSVGEVRTFQLIDGVGIADDDRALRGAERICALAMLNVRQFVVGDISGAVWAVDGRRVRKLDSVGRGHVTALAITKDFGRIYVAYESGRLLVWHPWFDVVKVLPYPRDLVSDAVDGQRTATIQSMRLSHDDRLLLTGLSNGHVRRWDANGGRPLGESVRVGDDTVQAVGFGQEGRTILTLSGADVRQWDLFSSVQIERDRIFPYVVGLADSGGILFHSDGRFVSTYASSDGMDVAQDWMYDANEAPNVSDAEKRSLRARWVGASASNPLTWDRDHGIRRWSYDERSYRWKPTHLGRFTGLLTHALDIDGATFALDNEGLVWHVTPEETTRIPIPRATTIASGLGGLLIGHADGAVAVGDPVTWTYTRTDAARGPSVSAIADVQGQLWWGDAGGRVLRQQMGVATVISGTTRETPAVAILPRTTDVVVVRADGTVDTVDLEGRLVSTFHSGFATVLATLTAEGLLVLANSRDLLVLVQDA